MDLTDLRKIVDRIDLDLHICTEALETLQPIFFSAELLEKFNNSYSAHVVNYLQPALHRDALLSLYRMWDNRGDVQSIPRVMRELQNAKVVNEIKAKRREAMLDILRPGEMKKLVGLPGEKEAIERHAHENAKTAAAQVDDRIAELQTMCDDPDLKETLNRNFNWRHKNVAHAAETTIMERQAAKAGVVIVDPEWGDLLDLRARTNPVVSRLMVLVADTAIFPEEFEKIFNRCAEAFWGSFVEKPR